MSSLTGLLDSGWGVNIHRFRPVALDSYISYIRLSTISSYATGSELKIILVTHRGVVAKFIAAQKPWSESLVVTTVTYFRGGPGVAQRGFFYCVLGSGVG